MNRILLAATLLLPLLGLGAGMVTRQAALSGASQWTIPIAGYDPRDPLRGRYIAFSYAWDVRGGHCADGRCSLCLSREGDVVIATVAALDASCPARVNLAASSIAVRPAFRPDAGPPAFSSRIFVSESSAPALEAQLRERPMQVFALLTPDGRLVNRRIEPAP